MNVVVTGARGYLGSALVAALAGATDPADAATRVLAPLRAALDVPPGARAA
jgi:nucleoside-diphosphate-sugar epimerase